MFIANFEIPWDHGLLITLFVLDFLSLIPDCKEDAELWLLNSCTVKNPAEDHLRNEIKAAHELGKKVVVAGCVSQGDATVYDIFKVMLLL